MALARHHPGSRSGVLLESVFSLEALGGSGSVEEIYDKVVELEALSDEMLSQLHDPENSTNTEV